MANRPTGPEQGDAAPEPTQPIDPAATAAQPPARPPAQPAAETPAQPAVPPAAPADQPAWSAAAPGAPRDWTPPPQQPPGGVRRTWDQAISTTGGRVALGAVAVLATLLVVAVIGLGAAIVGGHDRDRDDVARGQGWFGDEGQWRGPGADGPPGADGRDGGPMMRGQDRQRGGTDDEGLPQGRQRGPGGGMMNGLDGLDTILHGEFTTTATGNPVVMVVQVGEVTAYAPAKSITLESSDGFEGTYDLTGPYASTRIGLPLEVGAQVRVVAAKEGLKATRLNVLG